MAKKEILRLLAGFHKFRERYFQPEGNVYEKLATTGQSPKSLIIGCSDSRADPAIITSAAPGDIFVIRNVANLVPPFESAEGLHGISSAIEFAVVNLKVENIVVLGHRQCGGIRALMTQGPQQGSFIGDWMSIADDAKARVLKQYPGADEDTLCKHCEMEAILTSLENLRSFPFVTQAIHERQIDLVGIYFDLELGHIWEYDVDTKKFVQVSV